MKKIIVIAISTITIIAFSCGPTKNTPSTSSSLDSTRAVTDSARPGQ